MSAECSSLGWQSDLFSSSTIAGRNGETRRAANDCTAKPHWSGLLRMSGRSFSLRFIPALQAAATLSRQQRAEHQQLAQGVAPLSRRQTTAHPDFLGSCRARGGGGSPLATTATSRLAIVPAPALVPPIAVAPPAVAAPPAMHTHRCRAPRCNDGAVAVPAFPRYRRFVAPVVPPCCTVPPWPLRLPADAGPWVVDSKRHQYPSCARTRYSRAVGLVLVDS